MLSSRRTQVSVSRLRLAALTRGASSALCMCGTLRVLTALTFLPSGSPKASAMQSGAHPCLTRPGEGEKRCLMGREGTLIIH